MLDLFLERKNTVSDMFYKQAYTIANFWTEFIYREETISNNNFNDINLNTICNFLDDELKKNSPLKKQSPFDFKNALIVSMVAHKNTSTSIDYNPNYIINEALTLFNDDFSFAFPFKTRVNTDYTNDLIIKTSGFDEKIQKKINVIEDLDVLRLKSELTDFVEIQKSMIVTFEPLELSDTFVKSKDVTDLENYFNKIVILKKKSNNKMLKSSSEPYKLGYEISTFSSGQKGVVCNYYAGHTSLCKNDYNDWDIEIKLANEEEIKEYEQSFVDWRNKVNSTK